MARDVAACWTYGGCMYLENLVIDAVEPQRLGPFWEAALGGERLTDEPDAFETRLTIEGGPVLDLCFQRVPEPPFEPPRLHLDLLGGARQTQEVERLLGLGARHLDIGQREVPWVVVADPEGLADRLDRRGRRRPPVPAPPVAASVAERGGRELHPGWGELPWRLYADPSGNEFCVLPARS